MKSTNRRLIFLLLLIPILYSVSKLFRILKDSLCHTSYSGFMPAENVEIDPIYECGLEVFKSQFFGENIISFMIFLALLILCSYFLIRTFKNSRKKRK